MCIIRDIGQLKACMCIIRDIGQPCGECGCTGFHPVYLSAGHREPGNKASLGLAS